MKWEQIIRFDDCILWLKFYTLRNDCGIYRRCTYWAISLAGVDVIWRKISQNCFRDDILSAWGFLISCFCELSYTFTIMAHKNRVSRFGHEIESYKRLDQLWTVNSVAAQSNWDGVREVLCMISSGNKRDNQVVVLVMTKYVVNWINNRVLYVYLSEIIRCVKRVYVFVYICCNSLLLSNIQLVRNTLSAVNKKENHQNQNAIVYLINSYTKLPPADYCSFFLFPFSLRNRCSV